MMSEQNIRAIETHIDRHYRWLRRLKNRRKATCAATPDGKPSAASTEEIILYVLTQKSIYSRRMTIHLSVAHLENTIARYFKEDTAFMERYNSNTLNFKDINRLINRATNDNLPWDYDS